MQPHEHRDDEQDLMNAASVGYLPAVDVTDKVMARVRGTEKRRSAGTFRLMSRSGLVTMSLGLLLVSATAYGASEYIQIRNADGEVKVQELGPQPAFEPQPFDMMNQSKAYERAKPGELVAYYVKGTPLDDEWALQTTFKENVFTDYGDFREMLAHSGAPELPQALPQAAAGYVFAKGSGFPLTPVSRSDDPEIRAWYTGLLEELSAEAAALPDGKAAMKVIPRDRLLTVSTTYANGDGRISLSYTLMDGIKVEMHTQPGHTMEELEIGSTPVIMNRVERPGTSYSYVGWYNEKLDAYYTLSAYGETGSRDFSEQELLQLTGELIAALK